MSARAPVTAVSAPSSIGGDIRLVPGTSGSPQLAGTPAGAGTSSGISVTNGTQNGATASGGALR
jgi:hypothetical protein